MVPVASIFTKKDDLIENYDGGDCRKEYIIVFHTLCGLFSHQYSV